MNRSKPLALLLGAVVVDAVLLTSCSVAVEPAPSPEGTQTQPTASGTSSAQSSPATTSADPSPSASGSSLPADALVPGYAPGQFPTVPLFSVPDISRLSKTDTKLRDRLRVKLKAIPGVTVKAVTCRKNGSYVNSDTGLVLYGDGNGTYVGPDGAYTRNADGTEASTTDKATIVRDGKGGGVYVGSDGVAISNNGDGSGTFNDATVSITIDGKGGGSYVDGKKSITVNGDGSGTYINDTVSILVDADGSGSYVGPDLTINNNGKGEAWIVSPSYTGPADADPLAPVPALGKFPPVEQLLPRTGICGFVVTLADGVLFDFDKSDIRADAAASLDALAAALKQVGTSNPIQISGHTDAIGSDSYNQQLSERRASSVEQALTQRGVTAPMTAKGYGETRPMAPNSIKGKDYPAGRQLNRRVEIFVRG